LILELASLVLKKGWLHHSAVTLYVLASLVTPLAVWTGLADHERYDIHHPVLESHEELGLLTMWTALGSLIVLGIFARKLPRHFRTVFLAFLLLISGTVIATAHYGGRLVYEYGVGVK
jgi:uncharacterized membrane protein